MRSEREFQYTRANIISMALVSPAGTTTQFNCRCSGSASNHWQTHRKIIRSTQQMSQADRLLRQLGMIRDMSEKMLAAFESPDDWCRQVVPGTNHALWFAGHMAMTDNYFISRVAPGSEKQFEGWDKFFGMGSKPTNDPDDYPPVAEVLDTMRERRRALIDLLQGRSDAELAAPPAAGASDFVPDLASIYEVAPWHEAIHLGQVTVVRRALGNRPLFDPAPAEASA